MMRAVEEQVRRSKDAARDCQSPGGCWRCFQNDTAALLSEVAAQSVEGFDKCRLTRQYPRGAILYHQGSPSHGLYCVSSGRIKIYNTDATGKLHILRLAGPGEFLGSGSFVTRRPHGATAEVMSPAVVCLLSGEAVRAALESDPRVTTNVMESLARALEDAESRLAALARLSSTARIVKVLLEQSEPTGQEDRVAPLTREEIGHLTGTAIETVSRLIHSLARKGVLRLRARVIYIVDRPALEELLVSGKD